MNRAPGLIAVLALVGAVAMCSAPVAHAGAPMVIPQNTTTNLSAPEKTEVALDYPEQGQSNLKTQYGAITAPQFHGEGGYISLMGDTVTRPVVWDDLGSGVPQIQGILNRWRATLPGLYGYHCQCGLNERGDGRIYVVGPRPRITAIMVSPDNTNPPVSYTLDGSTSSVTDWTAHQIVKYEWDLNGDGAYDPAGGDQVGPEPSAPVTFAEAGAHSVGLRVTDDSLPPRAVETTLVVNVPKATTAQGTGARPGDTTDTADKKSDFGNTYKKARVAIKTRSKISLSLLRKNGLTVRITGLTPGDVVGATLAKSLRKGKKRTLRSLGSRSGRASRTSITLKIRLRKNAARIIRAKPRAKSVRLGIKVEGADGFTITKAKNVRLG